MGKANQNSSPTKGEQANSNNDSSTSEEQMSSLTPLDGVNIQESDASKDDHADDDLKFQNFKLSLGSNMILEVGTITYNKRHKVEKDGDEIRNERRKQANRESAKRSRLRKQRERKELEAIKNTLGEEFSILTMQMRTLSEDCATLMEENASLMDELEKQYGPEVVADLKTTNSYSCDK